VRSGSRRVHAGLGPPGLTATGPDDPAERPAITPIGGSRLEKRTFVYASRGKVPGTRHLSQRISEGDGIAIIVRVSDADGARAAEAQGAKAIALAQAIEGIRNVTTLPVLWTGRRPAVDADAQTVGPNDPAGTTDVEPVVHVHDEEELEIALELHDPEIFLLSARDGSPDDPLEIVLELLPDVPAGKLAIAGLDAATRGDAIELERAGFDAVLVGSGDVAELVGSRHPDV
jgi:hypothetical protein